jgi:hypothetical protein
VSLRGQARDSIINGSMENGKMPSRALTIWQTDSWSRLIKIDGQCAAGHAALPANPELVDENLRAYVLLTAAHFQRFCRDLYTECAQLIASAVPASFQKVVQKQFTTNLSLNQGNATEQTITEDFGRVVVGLDLRGADPRNSRRLADLASLNSFRNIAAHHKPLAPSTFPDLVTIRTWKNSCSALAISLDQILYNELSPILGHEPWVP